MSKFNPTVYVFGATDLTIQSPGPDYSFETREMNVKCFETDADIEKLLVTGLPDIIVSFGEESSFTSLLKLPYELRKRWLNYPKDAPTDNLGANIMHCMMFNWTSKRLNPMPLVSLVTPTYNSGDRIVRAYNSIKNQTYDNWEWVLYDDSDDNGFTFKRLCEMAKKDHRLSVFKGHKHVGKIGGSKRRAFGLAKGEILVEMDHDDELTRDALSLMVSGFNQFPDAGFAYSDWTEPLGNGLFNKYGDDWGLGYGEDYSYIHEGNSYYVHKAPNINPYTIRHIVSAPNHFRAWTKEAYWSIGGHNPEIPIADDFEICIRTFLNTRMIRIPRMCYIQHMDGKNTHPKVVNTIQRYVRYIKSYYDIRIHDRFLELGIPDTIWDEEGKYSWIKAPHPENEGVANYTSKIA